MKFLDVVSIGSATEDVFVFIHPRVFKGNICLVPGSKIEAERMETFTGGGATNTAVGFSHMGLKTGIVAVIGKDEAGKRIEKELKKEKISLPHLIHSKNKKTHYSVILTGFHRQRVILTYRGATASVEDLSKFNWNKINSGWVHLSSLHGSFPLVKKIINSLQSKGIKISFNPGKKELMNGLKKMAPLMEKCSVFTVNEEEAKMLTGNESIIHNLKSLQKHCPIAVITAGPKGAYCFGGRQKLFLPALKVKVIDATGAGDAFNSGFVSALIKGKEIGTALAWGMAQAQSEIRHLGTKNKLMDEKEMAKFIAKNKKKMKIREIH